MEIVGVGTDIVECLRVGRMIEQHGELFLARVYTEREVRFCQSRRRATEHFAARWAAKEAVLKALGRPWRRGMEWTDLEVSQEPGAPACVLLCGATRELAQGLRISNVFLSMAHCRAYATAHAVAVRG
jgi:holo-[acyl-carrier protein] synthase